MLQLPAPAMLALLSFAQSADAQSLGHYPHKAGRHQVPKHTKFIWNPGDGVLELEVNRSLRVATVGKGPASRLVLRPGKAVVHEKFAFRDRTVFLSENPSLCLGSETGQVEDGARIVAQPCDKSGEQPSPHQAFHFGLDNRIKSIGSAMCMVVKNNKMVPGAEIVLGDCGEHDGFIGNKMFARQGGKIQVKRRTDLHFNVQNGAVGNPIVLWKTEAGRDESFDFSKDGRLRVKGSDKLCLVALGGIAPGRSIRTVLCSTGPEPLPEEKFEYDDSRNVICASEDKNMVFNVKGGAMKPGDELVIWPVDESRLLQPSQEL